MLIKQEDLYPIIIGMFNELMTKTVSILTTFKFHHV